MSTVAPIERITREAADRLALALRNEVQAALGRLADMEGAVARIMDDARLLSRDQAARFLACSVRSLDRLSRAGALPVVQLDGRPRFSVEDLRAFVRRRKVGGGRHEG